MNSASDVWQAVLKLLEQHLSPTATSTWFSDCQVVELLDNRLILGKAYFVIYPLSGFRAIR